MFRFAHPEYLYALAGVAVLLVVLFAWARRKRGAALRAYGNPELLARMTPHAGPRRRMAKNLLLGVALCMVILGLADPQIGTKMEEVKREGVDIFICLDVSNSMKAEDIRPNRLDNAKREISQMLDHLQNDRIGLIVFAGESYMQLPLTTDYSAARLILSAIDVDVVPVPGTAIGSAIRLASKSFVEGEKKHKVVIVITDGENHEDDAMAAAKDAVDEGIVVHTVGMGSPEGSPIPIYDNGVQTGYRKDNEGNIVVTKLDESALQQIANAGGGKFVRAVNGQNELDGIYNAISGMEKKEFGARVVSEYEDRYQYFLAVAVLFLLGEAFISERRNALMAQWKQFMLKPFTIREGVDS